jgi:hypothetical protein
LVGVLHRGVAGSLAFTRQRVIARCGVRGGNLVEHGARVALGAEIELRIQKVLHGDSSFVTAASVRVRGINDFSIRARFVSFL